MHTRTHETITVKSNSCENVRLDVPMEKGGRDYSKQDFIVSNHSCLRSSIAASYSSNATCTNFAKSSENSKCKTRVKKILFSRVYFTFFFLHECCYVP